MVADQNDFAILRYNALGGLRAQSPVGADFSVVESAFDVSALETMRKVGTCVGADAEMATLEQKIRRAVSECTQSQQ
jgi:hypothetical protein